MSAPSADGASFGGPFEARGAQDRESRLSSEVRLVVQGALLGEITPWMRCVGVEFSFERIHLIVWYDGAHDEDVRADFDAGVVTQIVAHFPCPDQGDPEVSFEFVRCDFPERPEFRGVLVYERREPYSE